MVKGIFLLKRKAGLSHEEFSRHWKQVHGPLAAKTFPMFSRYVQNHVVTEQGIEPPFDGMVEIWYDDIAACRASNELYRSSAGRLIVEDEERFMDISARVHFLVDEQVIKD